MGMIELLQHIVTGLGRAKWLIPSAMSSSATRLDRRRKLLPSCQADCSTRLSVRMVRKPCFFFIGPVTKARDFSGINKCSKRSGCSGQRQAITSYPPARNFRSKACKRKPDRAQSSRISYPRSHRAETVSSSSTRPRQVGPPKKRGMRFPGCVRVVFSSLARIPDARFSAFASVSSV